MMEAKMAGTMPKAKGAAFWLHHSALQQILEFGLCINHG